jgi:hypothetical protein
MLDIDLNDLYGFFYFRFQVILPTDIEVLILLFCLTLCIYASATHGCTVVSILADYLKRSDVIQTAASSSS